MDRLLHWEACWNVRDLGGYATPRGETTRSRRVVRAGNLSRLTEAGRDELVAYGVRTVIDLRDPRELAIELDPFHEQGLWPGRVRYVNVPLISDEEWAAIRDPDQRKRGYTLTLDLSRGNIARVMSAIADAEGAVAIHCHAGKERTGIVAALLLELAGVLDEHIAADYVESDRYLSGLYDEWAERESDVEKRALLRRSFQSEAAHILRPLEHLRSIGGIETYLLDTGLTANAVAQLRSRLID